MSNGIANRFAFSLCAATLTVSALAAADAPDVRRLDLQRVGDVTYFRVVLDLPSDASRTWPDANALGEQRSPAELRRLLSLRPRLASLDDATRAVYPLQQGQPRKTSSTIEFLGQVRKPGEAEIVFHYPTETKPEDRPRSPRWGEQALKLKLPAVNESKPLPRERRAAPGIDDLEGRWAEAQANHFAVLEAMTDGAGFYSLAREATRRKYHVPAKPLKPMTAAVQNREEGQRLYEMTTGAAALAESLALRRLLDPAADRGRRLHDIADIKGIDVAEHPWKKMMEGKSPAAEPLAKLIPHDNYYVTFNSIRKFIEFGELSEQWGSPMTAAYDLTSRDFDLKGRYEKQLCMRSTSLGKTLGPAIIRGLAITGSDLYLREGSDVSIIFHVRQRELFLASVEPFLQEARTAFGKALRQEKSVHNKVAIESFVSPLREVSLHRASVDEFVIYSNSPVAIRRILDAHAGRRTAMADVLDFQYMRTIVRADDRAEDGFVFLSDAFIRQQVGPASKIKEKRRLEALASLSLLTHGALFSAWDTGKLPGDLLSLLGASRLRADEVEMPEGKSLSWDADQRVAASDAYNTIQFLTPLIELPMDRITDTERTEYGRFRDDYLQNWRQYFDPVGMRLGLKASEVKFEVYLLPLVKNSEYDSLREMVGGGVAKLDLGMLSSRTIAQYFAHIHPEQRRTFKQTKAVGSWFLIRWDDSPAYQKLVRSWSEEGRKPEEWYDNLRDQLRLLWDTPLTVGMEMADENAFEKSLEEVRDMVNRYLGASRKDELKPAYKGITITRLTYTSGTFLSEFLSRSRHSPKRYFEPALFHAKVNGAWYISTQESAIKETIDVAQAGKDGKGPPAQKVDVNSSLYVSPRAASLAAGALQGYLEDATHQQALAAEPLWLALYGSGVLAADASPREAATTARKFLGFVPVSPDGAAYRFDRRAGEVSNARHGSMSQPRVNETMAAGSPLGRLLEQVPSLRADLRFREDGIHTVVTLKRESAKK